MRSAEWHTRRGAKECQLEVHEITCNLMNHEAKGSQETPLGLNESNSPMCPKQGIYLIDDVQIVGRGHLKGRVCAPSRHSFCFAVSR